MTRIPNWFIYGDTFTQIHLDDQYPNLDSIHLISNPSCSLSNRTRQNATYSFLVYLLEENRDMETFSHEEGKSGDQEGRILEWCLWNQKYTVTHKSDLAIWGDISAGRKSNLKPSPGS